MNDPIPQSKKLKVEDFRRLGIRLQEWRPVVIRQAAASITRRLAHKQLMSPSEETARELSDVTISAYRILDPRGRDESSERVLVGRILPLALNAASHTRFCTGLPDQDIVEPIGSTMRGDEPDVVSDDSFDECVPASAALGFAIHEVEPSVSQDANSKTDELKAAAVTLQSAFDPGNHVARRLESDSLLRFFVYKRFFFWARQAIQSPSAIFGLLVMTVFATIGIGRLDSYKDEIASSVIAPYQQPELSNSDDSLNTEMAPSPSIVPTDASQVESTIPAPNVTTEIVAITTSENFGFVKDIEDDSSSTSNRVTDADQQSVDDVARWLRVAADRLRVIAIEIENAVDSSDAAPNENLEDNRLEMAQGNLLPPDDLNDEAAPPPIPSDDELVRATLQLRQTIPEIFDIVSPSTAPVRIEKLLAFKSDTKPGSPDFWIATMVAAKIGWSTQDTYWVREGLQTLADLHHVSIQSLMADSYLDRQAFVESSETHRKVLRGGFVVSETLLRDESLQRCRQVLEFASRSAEFLEDAEALERVSEYENALDQMVRLRLKANEILRWAREKDVTSSDAAIAGRYQCLYRRDWTSGLTWLAKSKDPRLAVLAKAELEMIEGVVDPVESTLGGSLPSSEKQWSELAGRWMAVASRNSGRAAESMRLHALALNEKALQMARGTTKLMIQREIDEIRNEVSSFALDADQNLAAASWTL